MKINSRKLLVFLFTPIGQPIFKVKTAQIAIIFPELSAEGIRSLLFSLRKKKFVSRELINGEVFYFLTDLGRQKVISLIPILADVAPISTTETTVILFHPSKSSVDYRPLRTLLKKEGATLLQKGTYIYQGNLPSRLQLFCEDYYFSEVLIFTIKNWIQGGVETISGVSYGNGDFEKILSGISKEVLELIMNDNNKKGTINQSFLNLNSVFERLSNLIFSAQINDIKRPIYKKMIEETLSAFQSIF